ncbi:hypothetical protein EDB19DRAFT_1827063 [Suillus lakei]|nr:hypothetical protein EDB19DRAFT_1827063 [Suillus lakei]
MSTACKVVTKPLLDLHSDDAHWYERPELLAAIADAEAAAGPSVCCVEVVHCQYISRNECILFYGYWQANAARGAKTTLVVEQVSHHPPITSTSYRIENPEKGVILIGHPEDEFWWRVSLVIFTCVMHVWGKASSSGRLNTGAKFISPQVAPIRSNADPTFSSRVLEDATYNV